MQTGDAVLLILDQSAALVRRTAALVQAGRAISLAHRALLGEDGGQKPRRELLHAGAAVSRRRVPVLPELLPVVETYAAARGMVRVRRALGPAANHRVRKHQLRRHRQAQRRGGHGALQGLLEVRHTFCPVRLRQLGPERLHERFAQVGQQVRHQLQDHRPRNGVRRFRPGIPRRRQQHRRSVQVLRQRRAATSTRPTPSTISNWAGKRRVSTGTWCGTARPTS